ncbi:isoleucine--tRNA ligase [bacterium]|nr:isoleucine--tRNA ligase [bacterium]
MSTTQKPYSDIDPNPNFPKLEEGILAFWKENEVFQKSVDNRPSKMDGKKNEFVFYDGPPFANGLPHYGHLLTGFVKDVYPRYQTMKGRRVERRFGWDCHGLPAEMGAEKELGISGTAAIQEYGIDKFNEHCRTSVMKYANEWEYYVTRQARWVDFKNDYKTMDKSFMESSIWAFKQLYDKGLVYESYRVMPYSWAAETPLSNFETRLDNSYREKVDPAVTVAFELEGVPEFVRNIYPEVTKAKLLAWTTTPWTLPSNLALAVNPKMRYVALLSNKDSEVSTCFIFAANEINSLLDNLGYSKQHINFSKDDVASYDFSAPGVENEKELQSQIKSAWDALFEGQALVGLRYKPLFPYFANHPNSFRVLSGAFVEEGSGTGVVHMAPGFGEDDQKLCEENGIELVVPVDSRGNFTAEVPDYQGMNIFEANKPIIQRLKETGALVKREDYKHNYPHCWRTDQPLIYKAMPSWYVEVTKFRDRMVELNQQINWIPGHVKDGLFGKWLEGARDWSISRNRFWGCPVPIWKSDNPANSKLYVFGSIAELEEFFGQKVNDLHRPYIDDLTKPDPENPAYTLRRVPEVLDCWFESGSMPYAQSHYPFEREEWFNQHNPADFIVEYAAQTRGWFYTMVVLGTALFDRPPFLNCICHGVVLDAKGQKLSKRLNNYPDPRELFDQYGADALRWFMMSSPIMRGQELYIDKEGKFIRDAVRLYVKPLWNAFNFFVLYANADGIAVDAGVPAKLKLRTNHVMDQYILAKLKVVGQEVEKAMDAYDTVDACASITRFLEVLNNWYIRRNKQRFWKSEADGDKLDAYDTLYTVLHVLSRLAAPLLPLVTESIWQVLVRDQKSSIHLADWPTKELAALPEAGDIVANMDRVQEVCNAAHGVRNQHNIRVRQPLSSLTVVGQGIEGLKAYLPLIEDEVNVKQIRFADKVEDFADFKLTLNFPVLGKKYGKDMPKLAAAAKSGQWKKSAAGIELAAVVLEEGEYVLKLEPKEGAGACQPLPSQDSLVALDIAVTPELEAEGYARDLVRTIQEKRKNEQFDISSKVDIKISTKDEKYKAMIAPHLQYVAEQVLAEKIEFIDSDPTGWLIPMEGFDTISLVLKELKPKHQAA